MVVHGAAGTQVPLRSLLPPHEGPAAPTKICIAACLEALRGGDHPSFLPNGLDANPHSGPWRAGAVAGLSFLFCERGKVSPTPPGHQAQGHMDSVCDV